MTQYDEVKEFSRKHPATTRRLLPRLSKRLIA